MANWNRSYITNAGLELIAQSQAQGRALNVTNLKTSSHDYSGSTEAELKGLTSLSDIVQTFQIDNKESIGSEVKLSATLTNEGLVNSYVFNAYGLYANIGSNDVLIFVAVCENPDIIPVPSSSLWQSIINSYLQISNDVEITLNVDYSANATMEWVNENKLINVTYSELKGLRDNSQLVAGQQYRITDFITIINGNVTVSGTTKQLFKSAGHPFDIIVIADSVNTLNENARAIKHDGDTYFANQNLPAWQLKYSIDNNTSRFLWASSSGKGVIYWMKDERNNIAGYDFKNIQMKRFKITAVDLTSLDVFSTGTINTKYKTNCIDHLVGKYVGVISATNLSVVRGDITTIDENDFRWVYTFNNTTDNYATCIDYSLSTTCNTTEIIRETTRSLTNVSLQAVNSSAIVMNIIKGESHDNAYEGGFYRNIINGNCYSCISVDNFSNNFINSNCYNNIYCGAFGTSKLGQNSHNNIFCYSSVNNNIGPSNSYNILSCDGWVVGAQNTYIQCGEDCDNWHVGSGNSYIQTGNQCENMFFGNACGGSVEHAIRMGDGNLGHIFLGYNGAITLGNNLEICLFKNHARTITIANTSTTRYGHITLGTGSGNKTFNQGTNYINVANSDIVTRTYTTADNNKVSSNATQTIVNIPISGWTQNSTTGLYSHVISVPGMYPAYVGSKAYDFVRPAKDSNYQTNYDTILEQFNDIEDIESGNGQITVYTYAVPRVAFQLIFYGL